MNIFQQLSSKKRIITYPLYIVNCEVALCIVVELVLVVGEDVLVLEIVIVTLSIAFAFISVATFPFDNGVSFVLVILIPFDVQE